MVHLPALLYPVRRRVSSPKRAALRRSPPCAGALWRGCQWVALGALGGALPRRWRKSAVRLPICSTLVGDPLWAGVIPPGYPALGRRAIR